MPEGQDPTPPSVSADDAREQIEALKRKNQELLDEKRRLKDKASAVPDGVDVQELLRFKEETERKQHESKGDYEAARKQLQEQYDRDIAARDARITELEAKVRDLELITPAASALSSLVHEPQDVFATGRLKPEMLEQGADGPVVVNGLERTPLADWAKQHLPQYMLKAPRPQGSGAPVGGGTVQADLAGQKNPFTKEHFSLAEQGRLMRSNRLLYEQMKKAAGLG